MAGAHQVVFGDTVSYRFREDFATAWDVPAIFDPAGTVIESNGEVAIESIKPVLYIRKSNFSNTGRRLPKLNDRVEIGGTLYEVVSAPGGDEGEAEMELVLMLTEDD